MVPLSGTLYLVWSNKIFLQISAQKNCEIVMSFLKNFKCGNKIAATAGLEQLA